MSVLKIISYNICALPKWLNQFSNPFKRIDNIITFLNKTDADIICLQEVFDKNIMSRLMVELPKYYFCHYPIKSSIIMNSGLVICSKFPILSRGRETFKDACGEDRFSEKGLIYITVKIRNKIHTVINTHLNADAIFSSVKYSQEIRMKQMKQVLHRMTQYRNDVILCGDFNIHLYNNNVKDIIDEITTFKKYCIKSKKMITFKEENKQLDYIFYLSNNKVPFKYSYKVFKTDDTTMSDHYPIQLNLTKK